MPGYQPPEKDDVKKGARSDTERRITELESLTAGLSRELSNVFDKLDQCEDQYANIVMLLQKILRNTSKKK